MEFYSLIRIFAGEIWKYCHESLGYSAITNLFLCTMRKIVFITALLACLQVSATDMIVGGMETTGDIELIQTANIENLVGNTFYGAGGGNRLKAVVTVTNPETDKTYHGTFQADIYGPNYELKGRTTALVTIPAGESVTVTVVAENLMNNQDYLLATTYTKNSGWSDWKFFNWYKAQPGITCYHTDGTITVTIPVVAFTVPEDVVCVDLTGTSVDRLTKNGNVNCLYIIGNDDTAPDGVTNLITCDNGNYTAQEISLTDKADFYSPVDFTATRVEMTYTGTRAADGKNGWNTIMVPFDVTRVMADDTTIDWYRSDSDEDKDFWLKRFVSDENDKVFFTYEAGNMTAYTPYIIGLPGISGDNQRDLSGKAIKFVGENVTLSSVDRDAVVMGGHYQFVGSTQTVAMENVYCINDEGNAFVLANGHSAFRACFQPYTFAPDVTRLTICDESDSVDDDVATALPTVVRHDNTNHNYYNLNGQRTTPSSPGLYIQNGRKVVR